MQQNPDAPNQDDTDLSKTLLARTTPATVYTNNTAPLPGWGAQAATPDPSQTASASTPAAPDFSKVGQYAGQMGGFDSSKLQSKDDAKYDIGRVLSNFDPTQGITPDVLKALNGLGYGNFSGSGDNLQFSGETDKGRQAGLESNFSGGDEISDYTGNDPNDHSGARWQYGDAAADAATPKGPMENAMFANVMSMLPQAMASTPQITPVTPSPIASGLPGTTAMNPATGSAGTGQPNMGTSSQPAMSAMQPTTAAPSLNQILAQLAQMTQGKQ